MKKKFLDRIMKKNCKASQTEFRVENVTQREIDKLYVKWKGYDSSLNSLIDKKDIVI